MCKACEIIDNYCIKHVPPDDVYLFCTQLLHRCIFLASFIEMTQEVCEQSEVYNTLQDIYYVLDCIEQDKRVDIEVQ